MTEILISNTGVNVRIALHKLVQISKFDDNNNFNNPMAAQIAKFDSNHNEYNN